MFLQYIASVLGMLLKTTDKAKIIIIYSNHHTYTMPKKLKMKKPGRQVIAKKRTRRKACAGTHPRAGARLTQGAS